MKKDLYNKLSIFSISKFIKKMHPKKKLRCMIFGNFGAMNLGDEAILAGVLQELGSLKDLELNIVSRYPGEIKRLHRKQAISFINLFKIISEIRKSDFILIAGGGIICKADRGVVGLMYQIYMLVVYMLIPKLFNKKVYAVGIGVYENTNPIILKFASFLLKTLDLVTVRDFHSYELLKSSNINTKIYKDNSYLMKLIPKKDLFKDKFIAKFYNNKKRNIGFALIAPDNAHDENNLIKNIINYAKKNSSNTDFWFYACDYQGNYYNDLIFSEKVIRSIKDKIGENVNCYIVPSSWHPGKFFSSFKLMDSILSIRLHSSIFAYRQNINFLSYAYDLKCISFLKSIGKKYSLISNTEKNTQTKSINNNIKKSFAEIAFSIIIYIRRMIYIILGFIDKFTNSDRNKITILSYHSIMRDNWRFSIDADEIKKQIKYLKKHYNFITLKMLEDYLNGEKQILKPSIILTFDDGYSDILKIKRFLKSNNIKPALFILSDPQNANEKELGTKRPHLTNKDIHSLIQLGWEIGSHTNTHPNLSLLPPQGLKEEIIKSKLKLEKDLNIPIKYFAYPRGKYNEQALKFVKNAGYSMGLTMNDGIISKDTNPLLIPRVGVDRTHSFSEFKALFSQSNIKLRKTIKATLLARYL
jgi:polysaccharide pyruvyl transferase WcaK-like protein/peptidoglycan/xylan/chitin deacetylase (PgdA/CDA1 family)